MTENRDPGFVHIEPAAVDLTAGAGGSGQTDRRLRSRPVLWLSGGAALCVALVVMFLLPRWVPDPVVESGAGPDQPFASATADAATPDAETAQRPAAAPAAADSPWRQAQQFSVRKDSQEILQQLLDTQKTLEQRGVAVWGSKDYARAIEQARSGDAEYSRQNFEQAFEHYAGALEILDRLLDGVEALFAGAMQDGAAALAAGDAAAAEAAFSIALAIDPIDRAAAQGMERAGVLTEVMELVAEGDSSLRADKPEQARTFYQQALELDSRSERARQQLQQVEGRLSEAAFRRTMSSGFSLLEQGNHAEAQDAFSKALKLKPRSRAARDGLELAQHHRTSATINQTLEQARAAEQTEDWQGAVAAYDAVLKLDGSLGNAQEARRRAALRSEIHARLEQILGRPERLFDRNAYNEAAGFREKIQALAAPGPTLSRQLAELDRFLALADTPVTVHLRSDTLTRVTLYRVGELGYFNDKALSLRPGNYVAVGHRDGYRDVRVEFYVDPDKTMQPVVVSSSEKIALGN